MWCDVFVSQDKRHYQSSVRPGVGLQTRSSRLWQSRSHDPARWRGSDCRLHFLHPETHLNPGSRRYEDITKRTELHLWINLLLYITFLLVFLFFPSAGDFLNAGLKLIGSLSLLSEDVLWSMRGLPNDVFPSDHLSLLAKFQLDLNAAWWEKLGELKVMSEGSGDVLYTFFVLSVLILLLVHFWHQRIIVF